MSFYEKALAIWREGAPVDSAKELGFHIDTHRKVLTFFQAGASYYYIFNLHQGEFDFVSSEMKDILGYTPDNIRVIDLMEKIHPEDRAHFIAFEQKAFTFFETLSPEKVADYKVQYDFRVMDVNGIYKQILHQVVLIEYDGNGGFYRSLGIHTDITHIKFGGEPRLSFIGLGNEPSYYNVDVNVPVSILSPQSLFSKREREILRCILDGKTSKLIAEELFLSLHTVNTHRKNMMKKSNSLSVGDLVNKSIANGWV